jgi:hypothetical protein
MFGIAFASYDGGVMCAKAFITLDINLKTYSVSLIVNAGLVFLIDKDIFGSIDKGLAALVAYSMLRFI